MKIYISGRIEGNTNYEAQFRKAKQWWLLKNSDDNPIQVINPVEVIAPLAKTLTRAEIMSVCFTLIDLCDGIYMLKGWQKSKGACAELVYAKALGKQVKYEDKQIIHGEMYSLHTKVKNSPYGRRQGNTG